MKTTPATILVSLLLASCSLAPLKLLTPAATPTSPSLYTDEQALAFLDLLPSSQEQLTDPRPSQDVLSEIGIDVTGLRAIDFIIGDCPTYTVYELSPSYLLIAGENACVAAATVQIRPK